MARKIIGVFLILAGLVGSIITIPIAQNTYQKSYAEYHIHEVAQDDATALGLVLIMASFFIIVFGVGVVDKKTIDF